MNIHKGFVHDFLKCWISCFLLNHISLGSPLSLELIGYLLNTWLIYTSFHSLYLPKIYWESLFFQFSLSNFDCRANYLTTTSLGLRSATFIYLNLWFILYIHCSIHFLHPKYFGKASSFQFSFWLLYNSFTSLHHFDVASRLQFVAS